MGKDKREKIIIEENINKNEKTNEEIKNEKINGINDGFINNEEIKLINSNIIRRFSNFVFEIFHLKTYGLSKYYIDIHNIFMFFIGFIALFNNNIIHLIIILIIISLDAFSIVVLHKCPLTTMEKKYLGYSSCDIRTDYLNNAGIIYKCDHDYEKQIELLINVWMIIAGKCLSVLFLKTLNIKLINYNNLYS